MGGKVARRAQVALFVLLGFVLLMGVILAMYLINQKEVSTSTTTNPAELYANNPELAAEAGRMQLRVEECLENTVEDLLVFAENGMDAESIADIEARFASELDAVFPDCLNQFNTETLDGQGEPDVTVILSDTVMGVTADYTIIGEFEGDEYRISSFTANVPTSLRPAWIQSQEIQEEVERAMEGVDSSFISSDGMVDLYAYADQGIYLDLYVSGDTCVPIIHDYSRVETGESPFVFRGEPIDCTFTESQTADRPTVLEPISYTCSKSAVCTPLPFTADPWPEDATILSALPINLFTFTPDVETIPEGEYVAVMEGTDADGNQIIQAALIQLEA